MVEVLQPTKDCDFVLPDEEHDMLPPGAALYKLTEPQQQPAAAAGEGTGRQSRRGSFNSLSSLTNISGMSLSSALAELTSSFSLGGSSSSSNGGAQPSGDSGAGSSLGMVAVPVAGAPLVPVSPRTADRQLTDDVSPFAEVQADQDEHNLSPASALALSAAAASKPVVSSSSSALKKTPGGLTLGDAILTFMNSPHPLQTLGEVRAYGHNGSISRYHNPESYTKALQKLCRV